MATQIIAGQVMEVPLPADFQDATCLPTVILQPTADNTNYMLKSTYATNGEPGVVDHAVLADTIEVIPVHGLQHLSNGDDPIPKATLQLDGLMPAGNGSPTSYYAGDLHQHPLPDQQTAFSEQAITIGAGMGANTVLAVGTVPNLNPGVYMVQLPYLYNPSTPILGTVHFDVFDQAATAWVTVTKDTNLSPMGASSTFLLLPVLLSVALQRVFQAGPSNLLWRLVLVTPGGINCTCQAGFRFFLASLQSV